MGKFDVVGLSPREVEASRIEHGENALAPPEVETFWDKLKENFEDPLIHILCVALGVTMILAFLGYANWFEGVGIAAAVFIATFVATFSEFKNESSFRELQAKASKSSANVFRDGDHIVTLSAADVVVGDYVLLQPGDKIPADGILSHGEIEVDQSTLNGESVPVAKSVAPEGYIAPNTSDFGDEYLLFRGALVEGGEGVLNVRRVGAKTVYGSLAEELAQKEERPSPLKVKLGDLADQISTIGYVGASLIAVSFMFKQIIMDQGYDIHAIIEYCYNWELVLHDGVTALILAIIVIVVAVPEGLPMMIAIVLSLNMRKLLNSNVLVRRLLGIETAGSLNILYCDKTGTLTRGSFKPEVFVTGDLETYGSISDIPDGLQQVLAFSIKECTSAVLGKDGSVVGGNSSEKALLEFLNQDHLFAQRSLTIVNEVLFSSQYKFSAVETEGPDIPSNMSSTGKITLVKGAAEKILRKCTHYYTRDGRREEMGSIVSQLHEVDALSERGVRVLAIATTTESLPPRDVRMSKANLSVPPNLALVGIIGVTDEIRPESTPSLNTCRDAGIQVVMITGDRKETAQAVAQDIGLISGSTDLVLTSDELHDMTDEDVRGVLPKLAVVARALPTDKSRLVRLAQDVNLVVGMTGDGVNDTTALRAADVGFAMGSGVEIAKEAADIVIMDDNFVSITQAVLYGRTIFKSIRKFIVFQSTVNCASMLIAFLGPFIGYDFPLTLIQLLWVNLVMDTLAALAFGGEAALSRYMKQTPIKRDQAIISKTMWSAILINGILIAVLSHLFLTLDVVELYFIRDGKPDPDVFLTAFFAFFIFLTNFNAFNVRVKGINIFDNIGRNPGFMGVIALIFVVQMVFTIIGGSILRTVPLTSNEWMFVILSSAVIIPFDMVRKTIILPMLGL